MKSTGIIRRLDDLGRIVIPRDIRRVAKLCEGDPLELFVEDDGSVIFKKYHPGEPVLTAIRQLEDEIGNDWTPAADREAILKLTAEIRRIVQNGGGCNGV